MRQRVVGVAADLVSTLGLVAPLMRLEDFGQLGRDKEHAGRFLRKLLTRNVVLFITRLHEPAGSGRTEETASIDGLLEYSSGQLSDETIAELKTPRMELIADLEASGVKYKDLYAFRAALIAHSIHREMTAADNTIFYSTIADFALKTYALVLAIERELIITGSTQACSTIHRPTGCASHNSARYKGVCSPKPHDQPITTKSSAVTHSAAALA